MVEERVRGLHGPAFEVRDDDQIWYREPTKHQRGYTYYPPWQPLGADAIEVVCHECGKISVITKEMIRGDKP